MSNIERKDIDPKYKWKLEDIIDGDKAFESLLDTLSKKVNALVPYTGKLGNLSDVIACLKLESELSLDLEKIYVYAKMRQDENTAVSKYQGYTDQARGVIMQYESNSSFIIPEFSALPTESLEAYCREPSLKDYDRFFQSILREKEHILSDKEERLLAESGEITSAFTQIFGMIDNADLDFPTIKDENGKKVVLTHGVYSVFMQKQNQTIRSRAFTAYYNAYKKVINTITATYAASVKKDCFLSRVRKFPSCLSQALYGEEVDAKVYTNLLESVGFGAESLHEYMSLRKELTGLSELHMYDLHFPMFENVEMALSYEEAFALVKKGLEPLGSEYQTLLDTAYTNGWIDVFENKGKRSGAYSWGCYGVHPYVLLNHEKTTHDVFTIAHELGHAMHSYYSNQSQPQQKADYTIFVAEVASTVNEVLLLKYILNQTTDCKLKKYLLSYYLDMFRTTLFRQTQFSEFEVIAHEMAEKNQPLTKDSLSDAYFVLNKKYYGDALTYDEDIKYEWARIPHFYTAFYVYKYATGITAAVNIAQNILLNGKKAIDNYHSFLCSGGTKDPVTLLKIAGVDLLEKAPFEFAIEEFKNTLKELKELSKI